MSWKRNEVMDEVQRQELARRFLALDPAKQRTFLARLGAAGGSARELPIPAAGLRRAPLSHAQERLWFLWKLEPDSSAYNICGALALRGALDPSALEAALHTL